MTAGSLLGEKRNELLALHEVQQYGRDSFGAPDHVSIYGLKRRGAGCPERCESTCPNLRIATGRRAPR